jgi:hypothetical protein
MIKTSSHRRITLSVLVLAIVVVTVPAQAQSFSVVYNFGSQSGDPYNPYLAAPSMNSVRQRTKTMRFLVSGLILCC